MMIQRTKLAVILSSMGHIAMVELLSCHHDIINREDREVRKINIIRKTTQWVVFSVKEINNCFYKLSTLL